MSHEIISRILLSFGTPQKLAVFLLQCLHIRDIFSGLSTDPIALYETAFTLMDVVAKELCKIKITLSGTHTGNGFFVVVVVCFFIYLYSCFDVDTTRCTVNDFKLVNIQIFQLILYGVFVCSTQRHCRFDAVFFFFVMHHRKTLSVSISNRFLHSTDFYTIFHDIAHKTTIYVSFVYF